MPLKFLILAILFSACSSLPQRAKLHECYRNNWHDGLWQVSQTTEDQVTLVEIPSAQQSLGRVKIVGPWYGGWVMETCPKQEQNWSKPLPQKP